MEELLVYANEHWQHLITAYRSLQAKVLHEAEIKAFLGSMDPNYVPLQVTLPPALKACVVESSSEPKKGASAKPTGRHHNMNLLTIFPFDSSLNNWLISGWSKWFESSNGQILQRRSLQRILSLLPASPPSKSLSTAAGNGCGSEVEALQDSNHGFTYFIPGHPSKRTSSGFAGAENGIIRYSASSRLRYNIFLDRNLITPAVAEHCKEFCQI